MLLGVVWWSLLAIGALAVMAAAGRPEHRVGLLTVSAAIFFVTGALAILSFGLVLVAAAAGCAAWAAHERRTRAAA